jgi:hypothetical protein
MAGGAVAGLAGLVAFEGAMATWSLFAVPGLSANIASGAIAGTVAGQYARLTGLVLSGKTDQIGKVLFQPQDMLLDAVLGGGIAGGAYGIKYVVNNYTISTPYGRTYQTISLKAISLRQEVTQGVPLYRGGSLGVSHIAEGQFWAPENPLLGEGYAQKYGVASFEEPDFVIGGKLRPGAKFIVRKAAKYGSNVGGALEVVTKPNTVDLDFFYMP